MDRPRSIITNRLFHHEEGRNRTAAQRKTKIDRFTRANITKKGVGCRRHPFILRLYKKEEGRKIKRVEHNNKNIPAEVEINKKKTVLLFIKKKRMKRGRKKRASHLKKLLLSFSPRRASFIYTISFSTTTSAFDSNGNLADFRLVANDTSSPGKGPTPT